MIPRAHITGWRCRAPWSTDAQIEQDLVICRALVDIFSDGLAAREAAFRGGTALHKLYFETPGRYSEDLDLVQVNAGPIGPITIWGRGACRQLSRSRRQQLKQPARDWCWAIAGCLMPPTRGSSAGKTGAACCRITARVPPAPPAKAPPEHRRSFSAPCPWRSRKPRHPESPAGSGTTRGYRARRRGRST